MKNVVESLVALAITLGVLISTVYLVAIVAGVLTVLVL